LHECVLPGEGGHERLVRGPRDRGAPDFRPGRVRPERNDIDDSGVVVDAGGGVVPGADVVVRHNATGVTTSVVTNSQGAFTIPGLNVGAYTVTVSLTGFKTFIVNDVVLTSGAGANVRAVLDVGGLTEQVTVTSSSEIVQTQAPTISTTVNTSQITQLPITSRSAMDSAPTSTTTKSRG
jgi:Carboxypeptidase regulatory-like domain